MSDHEHVKRRIAASVWREAEHTFTHKARLAARLGRQQLAAAYDRAAREAAERVREATG